MKGAKTSQRVSSGVGESFATNVRRTRLNRGHITCEKRHQQTRHKGIHTITRTRRKEKKQTTKEREGKKEIKMIA